MSDGKNNTTSCFYGTPPSTQHYIVNLAKSELSYFVLFLVCSCLVLVTTIIFIFEMIFIFHRRQTWGRPLKTAWMLGLYPMFSWMALAELLVPRSDGLGSMAALIYLAVSLVVFMRLMVSYFGSKAKMLTTIKDSKYNLRSLPCCCCIPYMPQVPVKPWSTNVVTALVVQYTIIEFLLAFVDSFMIANRTHKDSTEIIAIKAIEFVSSLIAIYGLFMFYGVLIPHLAHAGITAKFTCLKLLVSISTIQQLIIALLVKYQVIPCSENLGYIDNATRISNYLIILEALVISIIARMYYKRDENLHLHHYQTGEQEILVGDVLTTNSHQFSELGSSTLVPFIPVTNSFHGIADTSLTVQAGITEPPARMNQV